MSVTANNYKSTRQVVRASKKCGCHASYYLYEYLFLHTDLYLILDLTQTTAPRFCHRKPSWDVPWLHQLWGTSINCSGQLSRLL